MSDKNNKIQKLVEGLDDSSRVLVKCYEKQKDAKVPEKEGITYGVIADDIRDNLTCLKSMVSTGNLNSEEYSSAVNSYNSKAGFTISAALKIKNDYK